MSESEVFESERLEADDAGELIGYRPISLLAFAGLFLSLLSSLAFVHPFFWTLPPLAVLVNLLALASIRARQPRPIGARVAVVGLVLTLAFGAAAPTYRALRYWYLRTQGERVALLWFDLIKNGQEHKAHQLTVFPMARLPMDDVLQSRYQREDALKEQLRKYIQGKSVARALVELRDKAKVRYLKTLLVEEVEEESFVTQLFAVSYRDNGRLTSFLVEVQVSRVFNRTTDRWEWMVDHTYLYFPTARTFS